MRATLFTDPACPFAFSAEPVRQQLRWHYGIEPELRMIVLTHEPGEAEKLATGAGSLQRRYGMPITPGPFERPASSEPACRAVVATRINAPEKAAPLLRRLRVHLWQQGLLDDPALIAASARAAGVDPEALEHWVATEDVAAALAADVRASRDPVPTARAQDHKLGGPESERRYTAPSYVFDDQHAVPGFNPIEAFDVLLAEIGGPSRAPKPESAREVLEWADEPLATAEVVALLGKDEPKVRAELARCGDVLAAGADGYWTLRG